LEKIETLSAVRSCSFSYSGNLVAYSTDKAMNQPCYIYVVDVRSFNGEKPIMAVEIPKNGPKVTSIVWNGLDDLIVTGHDNGDIVQWDIKEGQKIKISSEHKNTITDLQLSVDRTMFISASKDTTAKLWDMDQLEHKKTYKTERPVNSASISPNKDHVVLGGGQEAASVTTTTTKEKFNSRFFHMIFEEEYATVKGHFGPINSLRFHPDGKSYASGGEDGYVRINYFDNDYHAFKFDY
jgi:translation initiation factor 3 subunit I